MKALAVLPLALLVSGCLGVGVPIVNSALVGVGAAVGVQHYGDADNEARNKYMDECKKNRMVCWDEWKANKGKGSDGK